MKTWTDIAKLLKEAPPQEMIKPPNEAAGIFGNYLEAQFVVAEMNRIFDVDGWDGYLAGCDRSERDDLSVVFFSNYTIVVCGLDEKGNIVARRRSNGGVCVAAARWDKENKKPLPPKSQALDTAYKGAISDSIKRTAKDFGNALGLWLYFDDKELMVMHNLDSGSPEPREGHAPLSEPGSQEGEGSGPYIYPKKDWKELVADKANEHGRVRASVLFDTVGDEAIGYMEWLWPKLEASEKAWDREAGKELKAWLDKNKGAPPALLSPKDANVRSQVVALLKVAKDDAKITTPIIMPLKALLAEAGYADKEGKPNMFHINGLLEKMTGKKLTLELLTVKQAKSLVRYCIYLIDNGGDKAKDFAQVILARAWAANSSWQEACDAETAEAKAIVTPSIDSLCAELGTTQANVCEGLSACGWPSPAPDEQLADFLEVCKEKGFALKVGEDYTRFDKTATALANAVAQAEGWVK